MGHQANNPTMKRGMVNSNTAFSHHLFQIAQAQGVSQIPANTLRNNIDGIVQAFERVSDQRDGQATP
ncbi:hypothetical protein BED35_00200 (plasmid) [Yersinia enterocolitica]|nr:hypothetical protein BB936_22095 [Yersinia enterocolitica]AOF17295.1 hypothetical protein BED34_00380 [Yersinia enterocolitica]AOF25408.1 hypothetical protein BED33_22460 [Yersinia enterocolitica]AOF29480.1 hypothetical protein BED32_22040 [Yersinia enterocolitica]AOF29540.1 hypothetical protein BED35_00200 [Yersinia enterocolitica]